MAGNPPSTTNLLDREGRIVADILERYRNVMLVATERISNRSNAGEAAYNSMHMDMETRGLVRDPPARQGPGTSSDIRRAKKRRHRSNPHKTSWP